MWHNNMMLFYGSVCIFVWHDYLILLRSHHRQVVLKVVQFHVNAGIRVLTDENALSAMTIRPDPAHG